MTNLTPKQQQIYQFIRASTQANGYPPTLREIGQQVGVRSPSTVKYHLDNLRTLGLLQWDGGKTRSITLPKDDMMPGPDQVPVLGNVAAGSPILAEQCIEEYLPYPTGGHPEEFFALRVRGDSMINVGIFDGDLIVARRCETARNGEIVVALVDDEATVKRFYKENGGYRLQPENDAMEPIYTDHVVVLGRVAALYREF